MLLYKTLWGAAGDGARYPDLASAIPQIAEDGWDGVSAAMIAFQFEPEIGSPDELASLCEQHGLGMSLMIHTFGDSPAEHARDLDDGMRRAADLGPHHVICHGGVDAWDDTTAIGFLERALDLERELGVPIAHETHRSRLLHSPWQARRLLEALPDLRVALDLSHWVVMAERLIHDQAEAITLASERAIHVDARIGHAQAPQVPDPRDPAWDVERAAFETWWDQAIRPDTVVVPEYGPPPYLPTVPFTGEPVADLWDIHLWAADQLRHRDA